MAQHRATLTRPSTPATHRRTHRVRWTLMCVGAFLACMWAIGHNAQQEQAQAQERATQERAEVDHALTLAEAELPTVQVPAATYTVTLPGSTVQHTVTLPAHTVTVTSTAPQQTVTHTHTVQPDPATYAADPVTMVPCANEDGSGADQEFPCVWDAATRGNGKGTSFWLEAPLDDAPSHIIG